MEMTAIVKVNGTSEREYKGKVYKTANLYIDGRDADSIKVGIPESATTLPKQVQDYMDKKCKAVLNLREFKGTLYVDLVSLEPLSKA
jgi:hypothetical protein